jgi:predicted DNA-binding transcriptional regulator YafY
MKATVGKGARLAQIFLLLSSKRPQRARELSTRFDVHVRTIERDLLDLQGEPFYMPLMTQDGAWWCM